ncbi:hypothetical protein CLU79DRAFT_757989 [Phycomyces nitens]|nr:hypothetical protein CLU79DRAFT_757989 [Phycomyces nitens]
MPRTKSSYRKKRLAATSNKPIPRSMDSDSSLEENNSDSPEFPSKRPKNTSQWDNDDLFYHSPENPLTTSDMELVFTAENFEILPEEVRIKLALLLPDVDTYEKNNVRCVNTEFFSREANPVFWAVLEEWQLVLAGGSQNMVIDSRDNEEKDDGLEQQSGDLQEKDKPMNLAGESKAITLKDMCRKGLIRKNDTLIYKRNFSACKVVVSKSIKVVDATGKSGISIELDGRRFKDFETPTALETKILDENGKVSKDKRPNGNAFKSIRLVRDGKDLGRLFDIRKDGFGA